MALPVRRPRLYFKGLQPPVLGWPAGVEFLRIDAAVADGVLVPGVLPEQRRLTEGWHALEIIRLVSDFVGEPRTAACLVFGEDGYLVATIISEDLWLRFRAGDYDARTEIHASELLVMQKTLEVTTGLLPGHASPAALGGPWTHEDHAAHPSFDAPLAGALVAMFEPPGGWVGQDVIDWGGGLGLYLEGFWDVGAWIALVEFLAEPAIHRIREIRYRLDMGSDYSARQFSPRPAHLSLCLEVLEHIDRGRHRYAFTALCRPIPPGGWLVFSAATPGQGGYGHVAERPEEEWRGELEMCGLEMSRSKTAELRAVATLPWFKRNLMCWRRPTAHQAEAAQ